MDPVDGNAIGSLLIDVFGTEMTAARATCAACGASRPVAELVVYRQALGTVVRCRTCGGVLMVLVTRNDVTSVDLSGVARLSQPGPALIPQARFRASRRANQHAARNSERITMSREQSMSMSEEPQEGSMSMSPPDEDAMSMGQPDKDAMSMSRPDEDALSMGQPDEDPM
jgi:hypothetical protein